DYDLNVMQPGQSLHDIMANILQKIRPVLEEFKPGIVLVHGDTTMTFATTLAAYYQQIAVGHVEAGLGTGNLYSAWLEEANRKLGGALACQQFALTETAEEYHFRERVNADHIVVTGKTVIDAHYWVRDHLRTETALGEEIEA